ncbi:hypothetical protein D9M68_680460 [compost metagenome]
MPPVVRDHEGVEPGPGVAHAAHERQPLGQPAFGEHHVRQRMVRPRLLAAQADRTARAGLGLAQQVALLVAEGRHAVHVGHLGRGRQRREREPQHAGTVAGVEAVVLAQLHRHQVALMLARLLGMQRDGACDVAVGPGLDGGDVALLARRGARRTGAGLVEEGPRVGRGLARFGEQVQRRAVGLHDRAGIAFGQRQQVHGARLGREKAHDEVVDQREAGGVVERERIAEAVGGVRGSVGGHGGMVPRPRRLSSPCETP